MIKKTATQLLRGEGGQYFTADFTQNKKILKGTMPSKPIQNKVAGYIARLKKRELQPKPQPEETRDSDEDGGEQEAGIQY